MTRHDLTRIRQASGLSETDFTRFMPFKTVQTLRAKESGRLTLTDQDEYVMQILDDSIKNGGGLAIIGMNS